MKAPVIRPLCSALTAAVTALIVTNSQAVHISPSGTGQVLIFPYYTVRNGFDTLVSVTNTQNNTKALKVRFREGLNGREVHNFNLFLSPNDTWTGAVVETQNGARLITNDNSCVAPSDLFAEVRKNSLGQEFNEFWNFSYAGNNADAIAISSLDRTREGYFEIIEMGVIDPALSASAAQVETFATQSRGSSVPANCAALDAFDGFGGNSSPIRFPNTGATLMGPPRGGLTGRVSLISALTGANYSFSPSALDGWSSQVAYSPAGGSIGSLLSDATPATSMVTTPDGVVIARWATGRDAVSAALMRNSLMNEFVLDRGTNSQTDWIATFPTKVFYANTTNFQSPFDPPFGANTSYGSRCDAYDFLFANREASTKLEPIILGVAPPNYIGDSKLCFMASAVPFAVLSAGSVGGWASPLSSLLASQALSRLSSTVQETALKAITYSGDTTTPALRSNSGQGANGKLTLLFNKPQQQMTPISATFISSSGTQAGIAGKHYGLPVIGVMLHNYMNANVVSRYGGVIEHSYSVRVE